MYKKDERIDIVSGQPSQYLRDANWHTDCAVCNGNESGCPVCMGLGKIYILVFEMHRTFRDAVKCGVA